MRLTAQILVIVALGVTAGGSAPSAWAAVPAPPAAGELPLGSISDALDPAATAATLNDALAAVQNVMNQLWQWLDLLRQSTAGAATQIVVPLPGAAPAGTGPLETIARLAALPAQWQALIIAARAKLGLPETAGATGVQHRTDIAGSPELSHEAATIAAADQQVTSGAVQQEVAVAATAAVANAAARDVTLPAAAAAARATGDELAGAAQNLPSSRAGIELLVAGMGAGLRQQADLIAALASRVSGVIQQSAQLSEQLGTLGATLSMFTARDIERERRALDAQLGASDAADEGGSLLQQLLSGAADPADEIRLDPLY